ncbi:MAG: hypothetical protein IPL87_03740 [Candidatus Moraniibacteriota bacterium]|nr:MAG: hypothetical protein IPL87_03740 [Candidatus Moranbacteria bacterium]
MSTLSRRAARVSGIFFALLFYFSFFHTASVHASDAWETITPSGTSGYVFQSVISMNDFVYVGTNQGLYRSADRGSVFLPVNTGLTNLNITALAIGWTYNTSSFLYEANAASPVFIGTQNGFFRGTLGGNSWTISNVGLTDTSIKDIELDQSSFVQLYVATGAGVFRSDNGGDSWSLKNAGMEGESVLKLSSDFVNGKLYAVTASNKLFSSPLFSVSGTDESWSLVSLPSPLSLNDISLLHARGANMWLSTMTGVQKSNELGQVWSEHNRGFGALPVRSVASDYSEANIAYAAVSGKGIYRMKDEASNAWFPLNKNLSDVTLESVVTNPGTSNVVYAFSQTGVYRLILSDPFIDIDSPRAGVAYSPQKASIKSGGSITLVASFGEPVSDIPTPKISFSGAATLVEADMTKVDESHYSYVYTAGSQEGVVSVSFSSAQDPAGNVVVSDPWEGKTFLIENELPTSPGTLSALAVSDSRIDLSWVASTDNIGIATYQVDRCLDVSCTSPSTVQFTTETSFSDTLLSPSTQYFYRVQAIDDSGNNSIWSNIVSATTLSNSPTFSPCSTLTPSSSLPGGYGSPFDLFLSNTPLVAAECTASDIHTPEGNDRDS